MFLTKVKKEKQKTTKLKQKHTQYTWREKGEGAPGLRGAAAAREKGAPDARLGLRSSPRNPVPPAKPALPQEQRDHIVPTGRTPRPAAAPCERQSVRMCRTDPQRDPGTTPSCQSASTALSWSKAGGSERVQRGWPDSLAAQAPGHHQSVLFFPGKAPQEGH